MRIVFVTSECAPYASTGGMGEVLRALPVALAARGHQTFRIMPLYRRVAEGGFPLRRVGLHLKIPVGLRALAGETYETSDRGVTTYFVARDEFFDRGAIYGLAHREYDDNMERFVFFQKAAVEIMDTLGLRPQVVHGNDWSSGLVPMFLRHGIRGMGRAGGERTVFTVHNLAYQGVYPGADFPLTSLPYSCFTVDGLEYYGNVSCLKAGLVSADRVTTVSRTYAREIRTEAMGCGLHGVLNALGGRLTGIANGIDYEDWDPARDPLLAATYTAESAAEGKPACRRDALKRFGLRPGRNDRPLIGMVSRLVDEKGLPLLAEAMPALMDRDIRFVLLGSGRDSYERMAREWAHRWPARFACRLTYDEQTAHRVFAGADIVLMPSSVEPCGLGQLCGMRYGGLPVVHATGGLDDTVEDMAPDGSSGTGFKFSPHGLQPFLDAVDRALALWSDRPAWSSAVRRAMARDSSWENSALEFERLYLDLVGG